MNASNLNTGNFFMRRIPLIYPAILFLVCFAFYVWQFKTLHATSSLQTTSTTPAPSCPSTMIVVRSNNSMLTRPLLMSDITTESSNMQPLKSQIQDIIQSKITAGIITSASVYVRRMNNGEWISYNEFENYNPGSLIKVPMMMSYLKNSEKNPGILTKELMMDHEIQGMPLQTWNGKSIEIGKKYTIKQLLGAIVSESDNRATYLINSNADVDYFKRVFTDLGMPEANVKDPNFTIRAIDYSKFLRVLYNSTYLNQQNSEFAMDLLSKCSFQDGMRKGVPDDVMIGHKFGEMKINGTEQLHESGIIYASDGPILLTIMTKGKEVKVLPEVITEITKAVYQGAAKSLASQ